MADMVTMRSPDGRVVRTDVPSEINTLRSRGYAVEDDASNRGPVPEPTYVPPEPPEPVAVEDDELTDDDE